MFHTKRGIFQHTTWVRHRHYMPRSTGSCIAGLRAVTINLVPNKSTSCPADPAETADAYLLGRLSQSEGEAFEFPVQECASCCEALEQSRRFRRAVRGAEEKLPAPAVHLVSPQ